MLNLANNQLGKLVLPTGWRQNYFDRPECGYVHNDGREQKEVPEGAKPEGIIAIANAIPDMGAISSVNLLYNNIPMEQAKALASILEEHPTLKSLCGNSGEETELDMSGKGIGADGATMLAPEIAGNRVISTLNLMNNRLTRGVLKAYPGQYVAGNEGYRVQAEWGTKDSDFGTNALGVTALADVIPGMRALTKLVLRNNRLATAEAGEALGEALKGNTVLNELDISSNGWSARWGEVRPDGPGFAEKISKGLAGNGALSKLDASDNSMFGWNNKTGVTAWAAALKASTSITELSLAKNGMRGDDAKIFADGIRDNGAMTSLNLAGNAIGGHQPRYGGFIATPEGTAFICVHTSYIASPYPCYPC
jgi:hypothetical protein